MSAWGLSLRCVTGVFVTEASRDVQQKKLYDKSVKQFNGLLKKQEQLLRGVCASV